jgi:protein-S-isoprenylcysteine O-methyltransferase Ste14
VSTPVAEAGTFASPARSQRFLIAAGKFFFRYRDGLFPAVLLLLVAVSRPGAPFDNAVWDRWLDVAGVLLAFAGQALRAMVIGLAYIRRGGLNRNIHADVLVVEGFFAHSRNPLYVGNFMAQVGLCLIHNSALCYVLGIPFFAFAYLAIVAAEEEFLRRRFGGEYDAYCRRVNRFVPSLRGLRRTLAGMRFDWRRLVRKEYGSTFAGASAVLALLAWDDYRRLGFAAARGSMRVLFFVWVGLVPLYLVARWLKKSGRLGIGVAEERSPD